MNLYELVSVHYAPRDSHAATDYYILAKSDKDVLEHLKQHELSQIPEIAEEYDLDLDKIWNDILSSRSELEFQEEVDGYTDLYYGKTFYRWRLVKEDVKNEEVIVLVDLIGAKFA